MPQFNLAILKRLQAASFVFRFSKPGRAMSYDRSGPGRNPVVQTGRSEKIESESVPKWTCECGAWAAGPIKDDFKKNAKNEQGCEERIRNDP